jgi:hypothetical protein
MNNKEALGDVRRKIGEVMKKDDNRLVFGYRPQQQEYKEGDTWIDANGRTWTIKDGIQQTVTKLDSAKTPWWCPKCSTPLNGHHLKMYNKRGICYNCSEKEEMELKQSGVWFDVIKEKGKQNHIAQIKDKIQELQDYYDNVSQPEFIHADNEKILMVEKWDIDLNTVRNDLKEEIEKLKEHLRKVESGELDEHS